MTQIDFGMAQSYRSRTLSEKAVTLLLAGVIIVVQAAWIALIGYGAWRLLFG